MYEHDLPFGLHPVDELVLKAEAGETIELLRDGRTVAIIIGIDAYDDLWGAAHATAR